MASGRGPSVRRGEWLRRRRAGYAWHRLWLLCTGESHLLNILRDFSGRVESKIRPPVTQKRRVPLSVLGVPGPRFSTPCFARPRPARSLTACPPVPTPPKQHRLRRLEARLKRAKAGRGSVFASLRASVPTCLRALSVDVSRISEMRLTSIGHCSKTSKNDQK